LIEWKIPKIDLGVRESEIDLGVSDGDAGLAFQYESEIDFPDQQEVAPAVQLTQKKSKNQKLPQFDQRKSERNT